MACSHPWAACDARGPYCQACGLPWSKVLEQEKMMKGRHTSEDLAFLREKGFGETADEIERLHKIEDATARLRDKISTRLNNCLCEMKPEYDDSITGFNEAWDIVRKAFDETQQPVASDPEKIKYWWSEDRKWFCVLVNDGTSQATVSLSVEEAEALMDEVMKTPRFLEFQKKCQERALHLVAEAGTAPDPFVDAAERAALGLP